MSKSHPAPDRQDVLPDKVSDAAARADLGNLVIAQQGSHPVGNLVFGLVVGGLLVGAGAFLAWLAGAVEIRAIAFLAVLCFIFALIAVAMSIAALLAGFTATYLLEGGLIHQKWPRSNDQMERCGAIVALACRR
jgi:hypothetical protein